MKKYVKAIALALALLLCLSFPVSVSAAEVADATIDTSRKGSFTIFKYDLTNAEKDGVWDSSYVSKLYVAYGSNLNMQRMRGRCPTAKYLGSGVVENYELQFKGSPRGAHATIAPKSGSSVPVGVWRIQGNDEKRLDLYEGHPDYYFKRTVPVTMEGRTIRGMAYIMDLKQDFGLHRGGQCPPRNDFSDFSTVGHERGGWGQPLAQESKNCYCHNEKVWVTAWVVAPNGGVYPNGRNFG